MSSAVRWRPGGQPSITQPMAGPWLSPQVVTRNRWPKLLCDMAAPGPLRPGSVLHRADVRRIHRLHADDVVAAIHVMHLAGHAGAEFAQQVQPGAAHFLDRH